MTIYLVRWPDLSASLVQAEGHSGDKLPAVIEGNPRFAGHQACATLNCRQPSLSFLLCGTDDLPRGDLDRIHDPVSLETACRRIPVSVEVAVTSTPGNTAPL